MLPKTIDQVSGYMGSTGSPVKVHHSKWKDIKQKIHAGQLINLISLSKKYIAVDVHSTLSTLYFKKYIHVFIFTESAHWADSVIESQCLSVCLSVTPSAGKRAYR